MDRKISIIIPTYNAEKYIKELLKSIKNQKLANIVEVIVIDSSSKDKTVEIANQLNAKTLVIKKEEFDHGKTRTLAGKSAKGSILVYLTQDAILYNEKSIYNIIKPFFEDKKIGATYGRQIPYTDTNLFGKHLRLFNYPEKGYVREYKDKNKYGIKTAFLSNSFSAYKKSVLEEIGWFKENIILGEDSYAGAKILKAGYKIAYVPDAKVFHSHSYTTLQEFKRYFDIGVFHKCENWILEEFGKPEGEGLKYVKSEFKFLAKNKALHLLPEFIIRNSLKFLGYKLGFNHDKIPMALKKKFSMHSNWWSKQKEER